MTRVQSICKSKSEKCLQAEQSFMFKVNTVIPHVTSVPRNMTATTSNIQLVTVLHRYLLFRIFEDLLRKNIATKKRITPLVPSSIVYKSTRPGFDYLTNVKLMNIKIQKSMSVSIIIGLYPCQLKPFYLCSKFNISMSIGVLMIGAIISKIYLNEYEFTLKLTRHRFKTLTTHQSSNLSMLPFINY